jgi:nitrogen regulatory protein P-II 1
MMAIEAVVRLRDAAEMRRELAQFGVDELCITELPELAHRHDALEADKGTAYRADFAPRVRLQTRVPDSTLEDVVDKIVAMVRASDANVGRIFVYYLPNVVRIHTSGRGAKQL